MTKSKRTLKGLATSFAAIVVCLSMLLGTTWAWFTDSSSSDNNIIASGSLEVKASWANGTEDPNSATWNDFNGTKIFDYDNWEPGYTVARHLKIENTGSLAFKYKLLIVPNGTLTDLADVIDVYVVDTATQLTRDMVNGATPRATLTELITDEDGAAYGILLPAGSSTTNPLEVVGEKSLTIALKMRENVGSNYEGKSIGDSFSMKVYATQYAYEEDDFGNDYDKDATYYTHLSAPAEIPATATNDTTIKTSGENSVSVSIPATLMNALHDSITEISLAHYDAEVDQVNKTIRFKAIDLLDQNKQIIDLSSNTQEFTVTLPAQTTFAVGESVSIYHDGKSISIGIVNDDTTISYTTTHLCEVKVCEVALDTWDGTVDTTWYNDTDTEFTLTSAEQFVGFASLAGNNDFAGKTIKLACDFDLSNAKTMGDSFAPIGSTGERDGNGRLITNVFKGTFDGKGHTISNLYQSGWDFGYEWGKYGSIGLFSELESATVKNVNISGMEAQVEGGDISFIAGSATGECVFENIQISDSKIGTFNNGIGGIIGWSGEGTYTFKNISLAEDVVIGGLWGSFDSSVGGIVGQAEPGATYNFENVDIACRLDVYNDCTASYDYYNYRMCGMIIGRLEETTTIDGSNYPDTSKYNITCTNVTVTYGEWANYHYCEPTPGLNGGRGMRVEPGYAYGGLPADFDHSQCVDNHMNLIPFDQIFGGDQIGVKGLKTYDGVKVVYNNK